MAEICKHGPAQWLDEKAQRAHVKDEPVLASESTPEVEGCDCHDEAHPWVRPEQLAEWRQLAEGEHWKPQEVLRAALLGALDALAAAQTEPEEVGCGYCGESLTASYTGQAAYHLPCAARVYGDAFAVGSEL